jgi:hypothetical protein
MKSGYLLRHLIFLKISRILINTMILRENPRAGGFYFSKSRGTQDNPSKGRPDEW